MPQPQCDLKASVRRAMADAGFHPDFPADTQLEIEKVSRRELTGSDESVRDQRDLLWSSIDNDSSRDLDQIEYVERLSDGTIRLLIGIADVDWFVTRGSGLDRHAAAETVSVYSGVTTFPMLPGELSNNRTSLLPDQDRFCLVAEMQVNDAGETIARQFYRARARNRAKLSYSSVGAWLRRSGSCTRAGGEHAGDGSPTPSAKGNLREAACIAQTPWGTHLRLS